MTDETQTTVAPTDEQRRSRIELYRAHEQMARAIGGMPVSEAVRSELKVLFAAAFRMTLLHNDGHLSPTELMTW